MAAAPDSKLILVTGAAGMIGRNVSVALRAHHGVRTFDRAPMPDSAPSADHILGNLADRAAVDRAMRGVHTVVHLGGCPHMHADFMTELLEPNIEGVWHTLDAARLAGVKRFIFASSCNTAFGAKHLTRLTADTVHALNPYGATKAFGEVLGRWFHDTYGMEFLAVRIGYYRGTYDDPALREGWLRRIWLGPRDCARFFELAVNAAPFGYGVVYACSKNPENYLDLTTARTLLGYEPEEPTPPQ